MNERILYKVREIIGEIFWKKKVQSDMRKNIKNKDFTIISSNCIGGMLYNDLGLKFLSPTINLFFTANDFVKFCENLNYYLSIEVDYYGESDSGYPIGILDDIKLHFVHYKSFEQAKLKWEERKKRINYENIFIIATDRDGLTKSLLQRFNELKYKKVLFSSKIYNEYDFVVTVSKFNGKESVGEMTRYCNFKGEKYYQKYFDFINWLNSNMKE
ncbi:DUF1919 domain-containing protein [Clostridium perfringens]|nr:DUF1919 domain-containing protein [Clostridium perfringens]